MQKLRDRQARDRLSGSRLPDKRESLARLNRERDTTHRLHDTTGRAERHAQIVAETGQPATTSGADRLRRTGSAAHTARGVHQVGAGAQLGDHVALGIVRRSTRREQILAIERQRILADMHDGVGATLVSLLRYVQSGEAKPGCIARRVQQALEEVRIAVSALQPSGGDVGTVLGGLRYRLEDMAQGMRARLAWDVNEMPPARRLGPAEAYALQRIVLEAAANAATHSGATELRLVGRCSADRPHEPRSRGAGYRPDLRHPHTGGVLVPGGPG